MTRPDATTARNRLTLLDARRSVPSRLLAPPAPDEDTLQRWLRSAVRVPDHGRLAPWRFLLIRGDARARMGELLAARWSEREPGAGEAALAKERGRFASAPLVVAVIGRIQQDHRIPAQEQLLSCGCVCFALLLAAQADGFAGQWLTGWAAYDRGIADALGLSGEESVVGFVHIGTPREPAPERERPELAALVSEWHG